MRRSIIIFTSVFFLICCKEIGERPGNLLSNPGFEDAMGTNPVGWEVKTTGGIQIYQSGISNQAHMGTHAMMFGRVWSHAWEMNGFKTKDPVSIDPDNKYLLSFWYKTENIKEYPIPLVARINLHRDNKESLNFQKFLSRRDDWTKIMWILDTLPADALTADIEFYIWIRTKGKIYIDDVVLKVADKKNIEDFYRWRELPVPELAQQPSYDPLTSTGFFEVKKVDNRWWLVDPEGKLTWALATMGEIPSERGNVNLGKWYEKEYEGDRIRYAREQYELLESWGINSFAGWTVDEFARLTEERFKNGKNWFPMYRVLNFSIMGTDKDYYAKNNNGDYKGVHDHSFPDPFNPEWKKDARIKAKEIIAQYKGEPWFVGWFMDNEIDYSSLFEYIWGDYSAREFIKYLKNKYQNIRKLNETWTSNFNTYDFISFEDILQNKPSPVEWDDPMYPDFIAFERIMMEEYIKYTFNMVKELDPDHLIISNRLNLDPMMSLYRTLDLWSIYDVICVNIYPENLFFGFSKGEREILEWIHDETGKPIILGEWSIPSMDSGLYSFGKDPFDRPLDWSWPKVLKDQKERGKAYHTCMKQLASMPYLVGAAWFKVFDVDSPTRRANRGLIYGDHQVYDEFIKVYESTNKEIHEKLNLSW